jgi:hypothetical protein
MRNDTEARQRVEGRSAAEYLVGAVGVVYLLVGVLGFFVTGGVGFADTDGALLLGIFEVNPLHNIVHLLIGAILVGGFMAGRSATRSAAIIVAVTYAIVAIAGPFLTGTQANILALNTADHWLHAGSALVLGVAAIAIPAARRDARTDTQSTARPRRAA